MADLNPCTGIAAYATVAQGVPVLAKAAVTAGASHTACWRSPQQRRVAA